MACCADIHAADANSAILDDFTVSTRQRLVATGDLARWRRDRLDRVPGRVDDQVKIWTADRARESRVQSCGTASEASCLV